MKYIRWTFPVLITFGLLLPGRAVAGSENWRHASDIGVGALLAASVGLPLADGDRAGAWQAVESFVAASLVTEGLKAGVPRVRPDGSDSHSFPSGHTSRSFAAAASLMRRQGSRVGLPALGVAALVGVARVEADRHYWSDAAVGAVVGAAAGFLITSGRDEAEAVAVRPWGDFHGGGFQVRFRF